MPPARRARYSICEGTDGHGKQRLTALGAAERRQHRVELLSTVLLACAAVATAFSTYQSTRWRGEQAIQFSKATAARIQSSEATRAPASSPRSTSPPSSSGSTRRWQASPSSRSSTGKGFVRSSGRPSMRGSRPSRPRTPNAPPTPFADAAVPVGGGGAQLESERDRRRPRPRGGQGEREGERLRPRRRPLRGVPLLRRHLDKAPRSFGSGRCSSRSAGRSSSAPRSGSPSSRSEQCPGTNFLQPGSGATRPESTACLSAA